MLLKKTQKNALKHPFFLTRVYIHFKKKSNKFLYYLVRYFLSLRNVIILRFLSIFRFR